MVVGLGLLFLPLFMFIIVLAFLFWIWMLTDCAKRNFKKENDKIVWILVIALAQFIGALIYYFMIKLPNKKN